MKNNEKRKLAVQWFAEQLYQNLEMRGDGKIYNDLLNKAKEIESKNIMEACYSGSQDFPYEGRQNSIDYYKNNFE